MRGRESGGERGRGRGRGREEEWEREGEKGRGKGRWKEREMEGVRQWEIREKAEENKLSLPVLLSHNLITSAVRFASARV